MNNIEWKDLVGKKVIALRGMKIIPGPWERQKEGQIPLEFVLFEDYIYLRLEEQSRYSSPASRHLLDGPSRADLQDCGVSTTENPSLVTERPGSHPLGRTIRLATESVLKTDEAKALEGSTPSPSVPPLLLQGSVVRALDCDSSCHGFKSRRPALRDNL